MNACLIVGESATSQKQDSAYIENEKSINIEIDVMDPKKVIIHKNSSYISQDSERKSQKHTSTE